jgi:hypothetical protein
LISIRAIINMPASPTPNLTICLEAHGSNDPPAAEYRQEKPILAMIQSKITSAQSRFRNFCTRPSSLCISIDLDIG